MPSPSNQADGHLVRRARPLLGTLVEIGAKSRHLAPDQLHAVIGEAFAAVEDIHRLMSFHAEDSDISRINRLALTGAVAVDRQTWAVLRLGQSLAIASDRAFDLATGSVLQARGLLPGEPLAPSDDEGDCRHDLELLAGYRVRFRRPMRIDVGGIAKGAAVDRAIEVLRAAGIESAVVNAGGDIAVIGCHRVGIRDPREPGSRQSQQIVLEDRALATSGGYFAAAPDRIALVDRTPDGRRDGLQALNLTTSVSVAAPSCRLADALTKVALFSKPELQDSVFHHNKAMRIRSAFESVHFASSSAPSEAGAAARC